MKQRHGESLRVVLNEPSLKTYDVALMFAKGQVAFKQWVDCEFEKARKEARVAEAEKTCIAALSPKGFLRKL